MTKPAYFIPDEYREVQPSPNHPQYAHGWFAAWHRNSSFPRNLRGFFPGVACGFILCNVLWMVSNAR